MGARLTEDDRRARLRECEAELTDIRARLVGCSRYSVERDRLLARRKDVWVWQWRLRDPARLEAHRARARRWKERQRA